MAERGKPARGEFEWGEQRYAYRVESWTIFDREKDHEVDQKRIMREADLEKAESINIKVYDPDNEDRFRYMTLYGPYFGLDQFGEIIGDYFDPDDSDAYGLAEVA